MNLKMYKYLAMTLLATTLCLPACDQVKSLTGDTKVEDTKVTETTEPKKEDPPKEDPPKEDPPKKDMGKDMAKDMGKEEAAPAVDEGKFINALYETTCVQIHVTKTELQKPIVAAILARYELTQAQFDGAKKTLAAQENVKLALKARMDKKECTKKAAAKFLTQGASEVAETKPKPKPKPKFYGTRTQSIRSGDVTNGKLRISIQPSGKVSATFSGKREGKFFNIPMSGRVDKKGYWSAAGKQGTNRVNIKGYATAKDTTGQLTATINKKSFKTRVSAR